MPVQLRTGRGLQWFNASGDGTAASPFTLIFKQEQPVHGIQFPTNPTLYQEFFRDDRGLKYYYDGARWLTENEYAIALATGYATIATGSPPIVVLPTLYKKYITTIATSIKIETVIGATNYWQVLLQSLNGDQTALDVLLNFDTKTNSINVVKQLNNAPLVQIPVNYAHYKYTIQKSGLPGQLTLSSVMYYREIG